MFFFLIGSDDFVLCANVYKHYSTKSESPHYDIWLRARPKAEWVLLRIRENPEYERPAGRPAVVTLWEAYISGTESPIGKRSSLVGTPIPSTVYGTNTESCQYPLWHVARATWRDVTNIPPVVSR